MDEKIFCEEQDKPDLSDDTLAHYGIKGMRWGFRRRRTRKRNNWGLVPEGTGRGTGSYASQSRRKNGYTGQILKYKPKSSLGSWDSAMYGDSRYERKTNGINVHRDKRYTNQGSAINYNTDKRFQRQTNGMEVLRDERYHGPFKRWKR